MKQKQIVLERSSKLNLDPEFYKVGEARQCTMCTLSYLIFVIFFTRAKFLENRIYTEKRQFFALNL